ncbi:Uncharacterised protein [Campylobacter geochelonis]|uniref:DUF3108 domain-containing protein n=2 Tax=Campylobacter geochelonis TaxID=1780362 RepID=A0A128EEW2_9BACT|nr:Uncharacterised protein [Campylobacter geochelonis]
MRALLLLIFINFAFASEIYMKYDVSFGIFGKVGEADAKLVKHENNATYEISIDAKTTGLANSLSGDRREYFYSTGEIYKDYFLPHLYTHRVERNKGGKVRVDEKIFTFNQRKSQIHFVRYKGEKGNISKSDDKILDYYAQNDLLSLFFNFSKIKHDEELYALIAAGANKKDGRVDVFMPSGSKKESLQKALDTKYQPYIVYINQKIFSSKKGELHLSLDENGYAKKAILKDVIFFGDIVGEAK